MMTLNGRLGVIFEFVKTHNFLYKFINQVIEFFGLDKTKTEENK